MTRAARRATALCATGLALLAAACAARLAPLPPEAPSLTAVWAERRAAFPSVQALADVRVDVPRHGTAWPAFTAVFTFRIPDRIKVAGFDAFGRSLFTWEASADRYVLSAPDLKRPREGRLDAPGAPPEARVLWAMTHLVDGVLGPEAGDRVAGVDRKGRWVVRHGDETLALSVADGRVTAAEVRRPGTATVRFTFADWRDLGPLPAPHRIDMTLPAHDVTATIRVEAWHLEGTSTDSPGPVETRAGLDHGRKLAYFDLPSPGGTVSGSAGALDASRRAPGGTAHSVAPEARGRVH